ncbi:hypothetical protein [Castellaniella sp.]|uniref:hypothetical protein n=1 Tax=Castellaniella sp. TaxID=1955812 RepID=UPI003A9072B8
MILAAVIGFIGLPPNPAVWLVTADQVLLGAGFGMLSTPLLVGVQSKVPWGQRGVATSANMWSRYLGQSLGAALAGALFNNAMNNTLAGAPADLPAQARQDAEQRFRRTLERTFGGPEQTLEAYRAWATAEDTAENEMAPDDVVLAKRWIAAAGRARGDAFQALGEMEAWFEVRVAKPGYTL